MALLLEIRIKRLKAYDIEMAHEAPQRNVFVIYVMNQPHVTTGFLNDSLMEKETISQNSPIRNTALHSEIKLLTPKFQYCINSVLADQPGTSKVLYAIELNNTCPAILDYVVQPSNGFWTTEQKGILLNNDEELSIFVMVQNNENIFKTTEHIKIVNGETFILPTKNFTSSEDCEGTKTQIAHSSCTLSETITSNRKNFCEGAIIFEENFGEDTLNLDRWTYDIRLRLDAMISEFVVFDNSERNQFIKSGILYIVPTIVDADIRSRGGSLNLSSRCTAVINPKRHCTITNDGHFIVLPPVHSTQIHTRKFFSFMYGKVEVRAKLPKGDWILPYLLLQPLSTLVDSEQAPQMRIAFARGNTKLIDNQRNTEVGGSLLYSGIYFWEDSNRINITRTLKSDQHFGDDFHIYSLTWTKNRISAAVDSEPFGEITENLSSFQEECFLIFGVSVGGHTEFADDVSSGSDKIPKPWINTSPKATLDFWKSREVWRQTWNGEEALQIDYVKIYAL